MLVFIGEEDKGYFVDEVAKEKNIEVVYTGYVSNLEKTLEDVLKKETVSDVVVDIGNMFFKTEEISDFLNKLRVAVKGKVIAFAKGFSMDSELLIKAKENKIQYYITSFNLSTMKKDLVNAINGIPSVMVAEDEETPKIQPLSPYNTQYKTIAVAGIINRMGTTTICLQIVKYLMLKGKKACYIEMNDSGFVQKLIDSFNGVKVLNEIGKATFENIDMFFKAEQIGQVLRQGYDYYIYDFGNINSKDFPFISYIEKTYKILVCGSKPTELDEMGTALERVYDKDINYIYNFVAEDEQGDILEIMEDKKDVTFFAPFTPNMYAYSSYGDELYNKIFFADFPAEVEAEEETKKRKRKLFGKKK